MPKIEKFKYLGSIIQQKEDIVEDINHRTNLGWQKLKYASSVLCDKRMPVRLKCKVCRMVVRSTVLYGLECWPIKNDIGQRLMLA